MPDLAGFRPEWLETSEVSVSLDGPRVVGLSFFFHDASSCAEFSTCAALDERVMADERTIRDTYDILPRYWLKLHYSGRARCGLSHYFQINPMLHYPITTIRCFLRGCGHTAVGILEELLKPALEADDTRWGMAIKRLPGRTFPRVFFSLAPPLVAPLLASCVRFGFLSEAAGEGYREWADRFGSGRPVFISIDPTMGKLASLDVCDLPSEQVPGGVIPFLPPRIDYLKMRMDDSFSLPEYTAYVPWRAIRTGTDI